MADKAVCAVSWKPKALMPNSNPLVILLNFILFNLLLNIKNIMA